MSAPELKPRRERATPTGGWQDVTAFEAGHLLPLERPHLVADIIVREAQLGSVG